MDPVIESKLKELLDFAQKHGLSEISWQDNGMGISFRRGVPAGNGLQAPAAAAEEAPAEKAPSEAVVRSPMVGIFRRSPAKDRPPFVMEGNHVKPGDRLGVVECMKIPTDVTSYCAGKIQKILVEDGKPVEYGQPLLMLVTNESL